MGRAGKIWLIIAASLVVAGMIIFGGAMMAVNWNFTKLSTGVMEAESYTIREAYENIAIETDTAHVVFVASEAQDTTVTCYEHQNAKHMVAVKDGTLTVKLQDNRKWYEHIGVFLEAPKITVSVPKGEYGALSVEASTGNVELPAGVSLERVEVTLSTGNITTEAFCRTGNLKTTTGKIRVENITADTMTLGATTGRITVANVNCTQDLSVHTTTGRNELTGSSCKNLTVESTTGSVVLKDTVAEEKLLVTASTGSVKLDGADGGEIVVKTDTGSVTGTLKTEKVFFAQSDTGRVDVPQTTTGGVCKINTDTGSIKITIQ